MTGSARQQGVALTNCVALLDVDPALGTHLRPDEFREARAACMVSVVGLPRGSLSWREDVAGGFLVIRGVLTRRLLLGDRCGSELFGRGDMIYPACPPQERMLDSTTAWRVEQTALLAVLDEQFHRCSAAWPRLAMALHERSVLRSHSLLVRLAIAEHPQIARRVHLVLWHLADRWGRPEEHGMLLPINLSRVSLADLVCSTRESVSRSLAELDGRGLVSIRSNGYFLRFPTPVELAAPGRDRRHAAAAGV